MKVAGHRTLITARRVGKKAVQCESPAQGQLEFRAPRIVELRMDARVRALLVL